MIDLETIHQVFAAGLAVYGAVHLTLKFMTWVLMFR